MRLYNFLLFLYPSAFRAEYGKELTRIFQQRRRDISGHSSLPFFWLQEIIDILHNAIRVHWDIFRNDLQYTIRTAMRAPGFATTAILVTALGIGANTAVFSVVNHVLIRPLPYHDPEKIVRIWKNPDGYRLEVSPADFWDFQQRSSSFEQMGAYTGLAVNLVGNGNPERIEGAAVSSELLPLLGVQPVLGRVFTKEEDRHGSPGTVLISFGLWQSRFGSSGGVLGKVIRLNDEPFTIIGVLPASFSFPNREARIWTPFRFNPADEDNQDRDNNYLYVIGRLKKEVSFDQAFEEMKTIGKALEREHPAVYTKVPLLVEQLRDGVPRQSRMMLAALLGASICVLLIACTNLANLFLVRAIGRSRELNVRAALGAGRERLVRQLLTESFIFASLGALLGVYVAHGSVPLLSKLIPTFLPVGDATILDVRVLGFAMLLLVITVIGFGVIPALRTCSKTDAGAIREGTRSTMGDRKEKTRSGLVIAEVAATVILLVSSGLLIRALWRIQAVDPGFAVENVWTMQTPVPFPKYAKTSERVRFYSQVLTDVRAFPDVASAAYISSLPMVMRGGIWPILQVGGVEPNPGETKNASLRFITPGFFETLRIPIRMGRDISESDTADTPFVAVVSESFVREYWPGSNENPIGKRFFFAFFDRTIVGVVGDIRVRGLEQRSEPQVYLSYRQVPDNGVTGYAPKALVIRTHGRQESGPMDGARRIIQRLDPEMPITEVRTLEDIVVGETASRSTQIRVIGAFTILSLLLAGIGIHGLLAFAVSQRIPEIGLRIALGAHSNDILKIVVSKGFQVATIGALIGMFVAFFAGRAMQSLLAGIRPWDVVTFLTACAVAVVMTISGCLVPALRAIRVDPASVMRYD